MPIGIAFALVTAVLTRASCATTDCTGVFIPTAGPSHALRVAEAGGSTAAAKEPAIDALMGAWTTDVPGAVWKSTSEFPGWNDLGLSPNSLAGLLVIYPDGHYVWNAQGGLTGRWQRTGTQGYLIELIDESKHMYWRIGPDPLHPGRIYILERKGYDYYQGQRAH